MSVTRFRSTTSPRRREQGATAHRRLHQNSPQQGLGVVLGALAALAAACSSSSPTSAQEVVRGAVEATADGGAARVSMSGIIESADGPQAVTADGVADVARSRGRFDMDLTAFGLGAVEVVFDGAVIYLSVPSEVLPIPTPWASIDVDRLAAEGGAGILEGLRGADPTQVLDLLGAATDVEELGEEEVRGVSTTHYRFTIDVEAALESLPEEARQALGAFSSALADTRAPAEVWIDGEGRVRRLSSVLELGGGSGQESTLNLEMYDYGTTAPIEIPAEADVTDLSAILSP